MIAVNDMLGFEVVADGHVLAEGTGAGYVRPLRSRASRDRPSRRRGVRRLVRRHARHRPGALARTARVGSGRNGWPWPSTRTGPKSTVACRP